MGKNGKKAEERRTRVHAVDPRSSSSSSGGGSEPMSVGSGSLVPTPVEPFTTTSESISPLVPSTPGEEEVPPLPGQVFVPEMDPYTPDRNPDSPLLEPSEESAPEPPPEPQVGYKAVLGKWMEDETEEGATDDDVPPLEEDVAVPGPSGVQAIQLDEPATVEEAPKSESSSSSKSGSKEASKSDLSDDYVRLVPNPMARVNPERTEKRAKGREMDVEEVAEKMRKVDVEEARKLATFADPPPMTEAQAEAAQLRAMDSGGEEASSTTCCILKKMRSKCCESSSPSTSTYTLLQDIPPEKQLSKKEKSDTQEEIEFFSDNGSSCSIVVEKNLRCVDLTLMVAVKNCVRKDFAWSIIEHWTELGLERVLEDFEDIFSVYRQTAKAVKKQIFRRNESKYDFFENPENYFPSDMVELREGEDGKTPITADDALLSFFDRPLIFSQVFIRDASNPNVWEKTFLLLKNSKLFMSSNVHVVAKFLRLWRARQAYYTALDDSDDTDDDHAGLEVVANVNDYEIYSSLNSKNHLKAPTEFGVCMRRSGEEDFSSSIVFSCEQEKDRTCWLTAMRLAKYGKLLKQCYREFLFKQKHYDSNEDVNAGIPFSESSLSRVPMDFTGSVGRIVEDPKEAREIATSEALGTDDTRRLRLSTAAAAAAALAASSTTMSDFQARERQLANKPWYHKNMTREQANRALSTYSFQNGTFLIRDSRSQPGCHVLCVRFQDRVIHTRIYPLIDPLNWEACYSLDNGKVKFYTLVKLVEFYRLNQGTLPIRLACHVEKAPNRRPRH